MLHFRLCVTFQTLCYISDFVLVYEEDVGKTTGLQTEKGSPDHKKYKFLESLRKAGLEIEEVSKLSVLQYNLLQRVE